MQAFFFKDILNRYTSISSKRHRCRRYPLKTANLQLEVEEAQKDHQKMKELKDEHIQVLMTQLETCQPASFANFRRSYSHPIYTTFPPISSHQWGFHPYLRGFSLWNYCNHICFELTLHTKCQFTRLPISCTKTKQ